MTTLIDGFGRRHNNLRISVTDRCNIRCVYCMPEVVEFQPKENLLTFEEITRLARVAVGLGVNKLRLTGGEPLVRKDLHRLVAQLTALPGVHDIGLTTNGMLLTQQAAGLRSAGLQRLNISLDTLDRQQFITLTRRDGLDQVLAGIESARQIGFDSIKINAIAMAGETEQQIVPLAQFCRELGLQLRFIEFMPLEADHIWERSRVLAASDILRILADAGLRTQPVADHDPSAPADEFEYLDGRGRVGIIASVTRPFCNNCNRIRLTADGKLRHCLFAVDETDLKAPLRAGADDTELADLFKDCVAHKWAGHQINSIDYVRPNRTMHTIGG